MSEKTKNLLLLHLVMLIIGFAGILGKLTGLDAIYVTTYRMALGFVGVALYLFARRRFKKISRKKTIHYLLVGGLIAAHWILFFEAIAVSNVSITLACFSSTALFTAVLEPVFLKRKLILYELLLGAVVIGGLLLIFGFETQYKQGIIYSLIATVIGSVFIILNGHFVKEEDSDIITLYEMLGGVIVLCFIMLVSGGFKLENFLVSPSPEGVIYDKVIYIMLLGFIGTSFTFIAGVHVMRKISTYTVSLAQNLEPVYGILFALLIFKNDEHMSIGFYLGTAIILSAMFLDRFFKRKTNN